MMPLPSAPSQPFWLLLDSKPFLQYSLQAAVPLSQHGAGAGGAQLITEVHQRPAPHPNLLHLPSGR